MQRRKFLAQTGLAGLALGLTSFSTKGFLQPAESPFGIQLWSVKELMNKPKETLTYLSSIGYKQIESCDLGKTIYWGMTPQEFKSLMDNLGMKMVSAHCDVFKDLDKKAADATSIGMDYLVCPYIGPRKTSKEFYEIAEKFNQIGEICAKHGLRFAYHNHDYSFIPVQDETPMDIFIKNTNPKFVDFELDIYWAVYAGVDPVAFVSKNQSRITLSHIKDLWVHNGKKESCDLGKGTINYKKIIPELKKMGLKYTIVEQEAFSENPIKEAVKIDAQYMMGV